MSAETRTSTSRNSWRLETPGAPAWPHSARPGAAIERTMGGLSDDSRAKILGLNAARIFGIDGPA